MGSLSCSIPQSPHIFPDFIPYHHHDNWQPFPRKISIAFCPLAVTTYSHAPPLALHTSETLPRNACRTKEMKSFVINEVCHPNLPQLPQTQGQTTQKKRKHQTATVRGRVNSPAPCGILKITVSGQETKKRHPQNNLIISLSTPKLAADPPLKKDATTSPSGVAGWVVGGWVDGWMDGSSKVPTHRLIDRQRDTCLTLTDRLTFGVTVSVCLFN